MKPPERRRRSGDRRYWPLYDVAAAAGMPVAIHVGGIAAGNALEWYGLV